LPFNSRLPFYLACRSLTVLHVCLSEMLALLTALSLRTGGRLSSSANFAYVADFGFYSGGTVSVYLDSTPGNLSYAVNLVIFTTDAYTQWYNERMITGMWHRCVSSNTLANWNTTLTQLP
jgi:hypothetical protein